MYDLALTKNEKREGKWQEKKEKTKSQKKKYHPPKEKINSSRGTNKGRIVILTRYYLTLSFFESGKDQPIDITENEFSSD